MIQQSVENPNIDNRWFLPALVVVCLLLAFLTNSLVWAHGGKDHANNAFTGLQALQKATELYDRLIINGKLDESWESDLKKVELTARDTNGGNEYRVGFHRHKGSPEAVFIFFSVEGKYNGSNYDGKW